MHTEHRPITTLEAQPGLDTVALTAKQSRILPEYFMLDSIDLFLFFLSTYRNTDKGRQVEKIPISSEHPFTSCVRIKFFFFFFQFYIEKM